MKIYRNSIVIALVLVIVLTACQLPVTEEELTCTELIALPLKPYIHQPVEPGTIVSEVEKAYGIQESVIDVTTQNEGSWAVSWTKAGIGYRASSDGGKYLDRIGIEYSSARPTAQNLLDCIQSSPEWYWAAYGPNLPTTGIRYAFILYFPVHGIIAVATDADQRENTPPPLGPNTLMSRILVVQPGLISTLFEQFWGRPLESVRPGLRPQPWPQEWEAIHFIEDREAGW